MVRTASRYPFPAEILHDRPGGGLGAAGARAAYRRRRIGAVGPVVEGEGGKVLERRVAVEDRRQPLGGEAVLVQVGRDRPDAVDAEVMGGHRIAELAREVGLIAADAGIDVEPDAMVLGHGGQLGDGVDDAEGIAGGGAHHQDCVLGDGRVHGRRVGAEIGPLRDALDAEVHVGGGLVEGRVGGARDDELGRAGDAPMLTRPIARRLDREDDALGPPARGVAAGAGGCIQNLEGHGDDLFLEHGERGEAHLAPARVLAAVEGVLEDKGAVGLAREVHELVGDEVDRADHAPFAPLGIVLAHLRHGGQEVFPGQARLWKHVAHGFAFRMYFSVLSRLSQESSDQAPTVRRRARAASVAAPSTVKVAGSTTTPKSDAAAAAV